MRNCFTYVAILKRTGSISIDFAFRLRKKVGGELYTVQYTFCYVHQVARVWVILQYYRSEKTPVALNVCVFDTVHCAREINQTHSKQVPVGLFRECASRRSPKISLGAGATLAMKPERLGM